MYYWIAFPIYEIEAKQKPEKKSRKEMKAEAEAEAAAAEAAAAAAAEFEGEFENEEEELETDLDHDTKAELNKKLLTEINKSRKRSQLLYKKELSLSKAAKTVTSNLDRSGSKSLNAQKRTKYVTPPFYQKVYLLWSSPFTKFWANFISYICFLILFGLVTLWPCCGILYYHL